MPAAGRVIDRKYLLVIGIPIHRSASGGYLLDDLWCKDLQLHRLYLGDLRLASPVKAGPPPAWAREPSDDEGLGRLTVVPLPDQGSTKRAMLSAPRTLLRLWKAVGEADVVHTVVAGWPYPLGWPASLFARLRGKFLIVGVESAPWRNGPETVQGLKSRLRGALYERLARWVVRSADLPMFTQEAYRETLLEPGRPGFVSHASWIDDAMILSDEEAGREWESKPTPPVRLVFAGRVVEAKGVLVLLEAARLLADRGAPVELDIMGEGDALARCRDLAASLGGPTRLGVIPPRPYGPSFFEVLRTYHGVVVPSLQDEQPRVIYDAYSQALPVLASATDGNRSCVQEGRTGLIVPTGDPAAMAGAILRLLDEPGLARGMGMAALHLARQRTHLAMHLQRAQVLDDLLNGGRPLAEVLGDLS